MMGCIDSLYQKGFKHNRVSYVSHNVIDESTGQYKRDDKGKLVSLPRIIRDTWLSKEKELHVEEPVCVICGEFASAHTVKNALKMGYSVKLICGAHIFNAESKKVLIDLKSHYKNKLTVYKYDKGEDHKPEFHSVLIGRHIFFESEHTSDPAFPDVSYEKAKIIEFADSSTINNYKRIFANYQSKAIELKDITDIESLPLMKSKVKDITNIES